jgi:hypothetical protein
MLINEHIFEVSFKNSRAVFSCP